MRQFKFRVWDGKTFLTADDFCLFSEDNGNFLPRRIGEYGSLHDIEKAIIQQFTGVKSIDGTEICEGDIIEILNDNMGVFLCDNPQYTAGEVKWVNEAFQVCQSGFGMMYLSEYSSCDCCNQQLKILGNIFEGVKDSTV